MLITFKSAVVEPKRLYKHNNFNIKVYKKSIAFIFLFMVNTIYLNNYSLLINNPSPIQNINVNNKYNHIFNLSFDFINKLIEYPIHITINEPKIFLLTVIILIYNKKREF